MKRICLALCMIVVLLLAGVVTKAQNFGEVLRVDPAADAIVPADATVEKLGDGFKFLEGPIWVHAKGQGFLLFSDIPANVIRKWDPKDGFSVFLEKSGYSGTITPDFGGQTNNGFGMVNLIGSNGITLDRQGRVVFCTHGDREVVRLEKNGKRTVLASRYEGKRLNSPNDLVFKSDGSLYFTDPPSGLRDGDKNPQKELPFNGVYRLSKGKLTLLAKDFVRPNGIAFSPDEKYLYVNDTVRKVIERFDVQPDGGVTNRKIITDMNSDTAPGAPDGMKVDKQGNIYCTGPQGFWIMSSEGKHLATIKTKELPANLNWGDADAKTLYLTARTSLYRIRLNIAGVRP
ncbi:MAG TPA: SMP-30/gluconolactonase/LRE family protein [Candidatus Saccharimonadales bacterium]|jgi:gluconolactonase|nr:SMP-30/gluconolactonase/LRE family protein [Candidatus Saccharimonadales bacterium]